MSPAPQAVNLLLRYQKCRFTTTNLYQHRKTWGISIGMGGRFAIGMGGRFDRNTQEEPDFSSGSTSQRPAPRT